MNTKQSKNLKILKFVIFILVAAGVLLVMTACGSSADSLEFKLVFDEYYTVTGVKEDCPDNVIIPSRYDGLPVREIAPFVFSGRKNIKTVVIPDSVQIIEKRAFSGCTSLEKIKLGNNIKRIYSSAFYDCENLKSITIPSTTIDIDPSAFSGCDGLEKISVKSGNKIYSGKGNCLIEKKTKTLIAGGSKSKIPNDGSVTTIGKAAFSARNVKNVVVPDSITLIKESAFAQCPALETCILPDGCQIEQVVFFHCDNLKWVVIPTSITLIDHMCFSYCGSLESIFYKGTKQQWENVTSYDTHDGKVYFYSEEKPTQNDGSYWRFDTNKNPVVW